MRKTFFIALALCALLTPSTFAALDIAGIEEAIGVKGRWIESEKVYKVTFPRTDVKVAVDGATLPPFMGLTTWAGFQSGREKPAIVMGDIVLFQDEVSAAMSAALENGLEVTALHNHFFHDEPKVYFMHIGGEGTARGLAQGVRKVLDAVKQARAAASAPSTGFGGDGLPDKNNIEANSLDAIFAGKGQSQDGMYKIVFGREVTMPCGCKVGKEMGVNTWAAFHGDMNNARVAGDFACAYGELQPVLKTLRRHGIHVVAIHNHMDAEAPRMLFLHYWGIGRAEDLAKAVKAALDTQPRRGAGRTGGGHEHHEH